MKVKIGTPGSVYRKDLNKITKVSNDVKVDLCPTCNGEGRCEVPNVEIESPAYWWWRKVKAALEEKPKGVELMLLNNGLSIIDDPGDSKVLDEGDVRLTLGESGVIKYITSEVRFEQEEHDESFEMSNEDLVEIAKDEINQ